MKRPDLSKLKPKSKPKTAAKPRGAIKAPPFLDDLYRDMRDRRLLLPALALIVAIVAVPVALSASKEPAPAPVAFVPPEGAEAVTPAVLAEQPGGIRDYRERLDELKSKNPFESAASAAAATTSGDPADIIVTPTPDSAATGSTSGTTSPSTPAETPVPSDGSAPPDSSSGGGEPKTEIRVAVPRLDVAAGKQGDARAINDVKPGDLLPSKRNAPIAMFLGASSNLKFAHFAISDNVTEARGDGRCRPRPNDCEFLRLSEGEKRTFVYGEDGDRYTLKVTDIREELIRPRKASAE